MEAEEYFKQLHEASFEKIQIMKKMIINGFTKEEINLLFGNCFNLNKDYGKQKINVRAKAEEIISFRRR